MIEEVENRLPIGAKAVVKDLNASGYVYERSVSDCGNVIYGIKLDCIIRPVNFVATEVWHCQRENLITEECK